MKDVYCDLKQVVMKQAIVVSHIHPCTIFARTLEAPQVIKKKYAPRTISSGSSIFFALSSRYI
jgi:hypothetical protein